MIMRKGTRARSSPGRDVLVGERQMVTRLFIFFSYFFQGVMHWWVSDEMVARLYPHVQGVCARFPSINIRVEPVERKRYDGKRLLILSDTSPTGLPERVLTCNMAAELVKPYLKPMPVPAAAGAHAPVQQSPVARGVAEKGLNRAGKSPEEQWLAALLAVIKSKGGEPMDLSTLANPIAGGVSRPDGVAIKLVDLLKMNAQRCGLVLNRLHDAGGYTKCTVAYNPKCVSSRSSSTAPVATAAASNFQRSEQASNALADAGEANVCNICFEEQCDTRMVPCLHKICHNCVQVPRLAKSRSSFPPPLALTWRAPCPGSAYHAPSQTVCSWP
jgi:hypothetical protein